MRRWCARGSFKPSLERLITLKSRPPMLFCVSCSPTLRPVLTSTQGASADNFLPTQGRAARRACKAMRWYARGPFERAPARPHTPSLCAPMPFRSCSWLTPRPYRTCTQGGQSTTLDLKLAELLGGDGGPRDGARECRSNAPLHALALALLALQCRFICAAM